MLLHGPWLHGLVVQVPPGEIASGLGELPEIRRLPCEGDARQHLLQVAGKASAILRRMQHAIDVAKDVLLARLPAWPAYAARKSA